MDDAAVTACSAERAELGEGPRWDAGRGELLWVDILAGRLHRAVPYSDGALRTIAAIDVGRHLGAAVPAVAGGWLLAAGQGFAHLAEDGTVTDLDQPEADRGGTTRMNDATTDPLGRLWAGSMAYDGTAGRGRLHRLDVDGTVTTVLDGLTVGNGMGWSPDGATMYLADSGPGTIDAFDYDVAAGALSRRRTVFAAREGQGVPDGLVVTTAGTLVVAFHGGSAVRHLAADGRMLAEHRLPVRQPTAPCLAGPDGTTLYVTTAHEGYDAEALAAEPLAGRVLCVPGVGVAGPPVVPYAGPALA